jgi:hypothetical protein
MAGFRGPDGLAPYCSLDDGAWKKRADACVCSGSLWVVRRIVNDVLAALDDRTGWLVA